MLNILKDSWAYFLAWLFVAGGIFLFMLADKDDERWMYVSALSWFVRLFWTDASPLQVAFVFITISFVVCLVLVVRQTRHARKTDNP